MEKLEEIKATMMVVLTTQLDWMHQVSANHSTVILEIANRLDKLDTIKGTIEDAHDHWKNAMARLIFLTFTFWIQRDRWIFSVEEYFLFYDIVEVAKIQMASLNMQ